MRNGTVVDWSSIQPITDLDILNGTLSERKLYPFGQSCKCCDRKSRAAYAQSFAPWEQATIEIAQRDHSIIVCSRHTQIVLFFAHIPFVSNHTINATPPERLQDKHLGCLVLDECLLAS